MGGKRLRKFGKILLWILAVIAVVLIISSLLHATLFRQRRNAISPPYGQIVPVFDGQMHLREMGDGEHTAVLLPGMGVALPSADFGPPLQRALAEDYKTVVVEYFGWGGSVPPLKEHARVSTMWKRSGKHSTPLGMNHPMC